MLPQAATKDAVPPGESGIVPQARCRKGLIDWARREKMRFAANGALRQGSNLISHAHFMLRFCHSDGWRVTAVSPAGSVGASACGRGCHWQPAPRLRGSHGSFGFFVIEILYVKIQYKVFFETQTKKRKSLALSEGGEGGIVPQAR